MYGQRIPAYECELCGALERADNLVVCEECEQEICEECEVLVEKDGEIVSMCRDCAVDYDDTYIRV